MAKNSKELGNLLANRLKVGNRANTGESQIGTANPPEPVAPPAPEGGISIPSSQLGDVAVGDVVTLEVVANDGENVSLKKAEEPTSTALPEELPEELPTNF